MASIAGQIIREARGRAGLNREQLAIKAGLGFRTVGDVERGRAPSVVTVSAVADALELSDQERAELTRAKNWRRQDGAR